MWVNPVNSTDEAAGRWIGVGVCVGVGVSVGSAVAVRVAVSVTVGLAVDVAAGLEVGVAAGSGVRVNVAIAIAVAVSVFDDCGMGELVGEDVAGLGVTEGVDVGTGLGVDDAGVVSFATDWETSDDPVGVGKGVGTY